MRRNFILAWALCTTACFAEPPSSTSSSDGSTSSASTGTTADDDDDDDDDTSTSESSNEGSTTTGGFGTASFGTSSSTAEDTLDTAETDEPVPNLLLDIYEDCAEGTWETDDQGLVPTNCDFTPADPHSQGGGWRFGTYDSPAFGMVEKALVLRPQPGTGGLTDASFNSGRLRFTAPGSRVRLRWEFVNTASPTGDVGMMSFQIRRIPPDNGMKGVKGETLFEELNAEGGSGVVDLALDIAGPLDDIVFIVIGDEAVDDQGVALYEPVIVFEP